MLSKFMFSFFFVGVFSYNNGVGRLPAMGWNTWNQFKCNVNESLMLRTAEGFLKYGLDKVGYEYVNIDDCWQSTKRDENGYIIPDFEKFPDMKGLSDKIHSMGLKFGLYTSIGSKTCQERAGSYRFYKQDAEKYREWNIDFLKVDSCRQSGKVTKEPWTYYHNFSRIINETGQRMIYLIGSPATKSWEWPIPPSTFGHMWRISHDIDTRWGRTKEITDVNRNLYEYAGPYHYNDPDMVEVGVRERMRPWTDDMNKVHFSLWCIMASPLILGLDLTGYVSQEILDVIKNEDAISINQDELGYQGRIIEEIKRVINPSFIVSDWMRCRWTQIWKKEMSGGKKAVLFFNRGCTTKPKNEIAYSILHFSLMSFLGVFIFVGCWWLYGARKRNPRWEFFNFANFVFLCCCLFAILAVFCIAYFNTYTVYTHSEFLEVKWSDLGIENTGEQYKIRDVWKKEDLGVFTEKFTTNLIPVDACVMIIMTPVV